MHLFALLGLAFSLSIVSSGVVAASPTSVSASISPAGINVVASIQVAASVPTLWATLTDYNHLQDFIPDMRRSRILSISGQTKVVEQFTDAGMMAFIIPEHVILAMYEDPLSKVEFSAIGGAVRSLKGEWSLSEQGHGAALSYRVQMQPLLPVPITLPSAMVEREVQLHMQAIASEAERRARREAGH